MTMNYLRKEATVSHDSVAWLFTIICNVCLTKIKAFAGNYIEVN